MSDDPNESAEELDFTAYLGDRFGGQVSEFAPDAEYFDTWRLSGDRFGRPSIGPADDEEASSSVDTPPSDSAVHDEDR